MTSHDPGDRRTPIGENPEEQSGRRPMLLGVIVLLLLGLTIFLVIGLIL